MAPALRPQPVQRDRTSSFSKYPPPPPKTKPILAERFAQSYASQGRSPLFSTLPPEIRNRIFHFALLEYDDLTTPVPVSSPGFRPEHAFRRTHAVALLRTCRRVYLEARLIPAATAAHVVWSFAHNSAPFRLATAPRFSVMTPEQRSAVRTLRFYAQQFALEKAHWAAAIGLPPDVRIRHLIFTVPHTDGWLWQRPNEFGGVKQHGYGAAWRTELARAFPALEVLEMELETLAPQRADLDKIVAQIRQWRIDLGGGRMLSAKGEPLHTREWVGGPHMPRYYVVKIRWREGTEVKLSRA